MRMIPLLVRNNSIRRRRCLNFYRPWYRWCTLSFSCESDVITAYHRRGY